jgi:hypothetical protein
VARALLTRSSRSQRRASDRSARRPGTNPLRGPRALAFSAPGRGVLGVRAGRPSPGRPGLDDRPREPHRRRGPPSRRLPRLDQGWCRAVIRCHNHPSGDPMPSRQDIDFTVCLREVGGMCGIPVLDHVVVGAGGYASLADHRGPRPALRSSPRGHVVRYLHRETHARTAARPSRPTLSIRADRADRLC